MGKALVRRPNNRPASAKLVMPRNEIHPAETTPVLFCPFFPWVPGYSLQHWLVTPGITVAALLYIYPSLLSWPRIVPPGYYGATAPILCFPLSVLCAHARFPSQFKQVLVLRSISFSSLFSGFCTHWPPCGESANRLVSLVRTTSSNGRA